MKKAVFIGGGIKKAIKRLMEGAVGKCMAISRLPRSRELFL